MLLNSQNEQVLTLYLWGTGFPPSFNGLTLMTAFTMKLNLTQSFRNVITGIQSSTENYYGNRYPAKQKEKKKDVCLVGQCFLLNGVSLNSESLSKIDKGNQYHFYS